MFLTARCENAPDESGARPASGTLDEAPDEEPDEPRTSPGGAKMELRTPDESDAGRAVTASDELVRARLTRPSWA